MTSAEQGPYLLNPPEVFVLPPLALEMQREMAHLDPQTAIHQQITLEIADSIFLHYIANLALSSDPPNIDEIVYVYEACRPGILLHDIGKAGIDPDINKSIKIINHKPPENYQPDNDHRSSDSIMVTELHSLVSGLMLKELSKKHPEMSISAEIAYGHHEHPSGELHSPTNGKIFPSYPRSLARHIEPPIALIHLITQLADIAATMGQPRIYRPDRQPFSSIEAELQSILSPHFLTNIYEPLNPDQLQQLNQFFIQVTLKAIRTSQQKHSVKDCLNPKLETSPPSLIPSLVENVWKNNRNRIKKQLLLNSKNHH
jgi:hypothetical protein